MGSSSPTEGAGSALALQPTKDAGRAQEAAVPLYSERIFYSPSKLLRRLTILDNIRFESRISQQRLGKVAGLSGAMVNNYIKQLHEEGLICRRPIDGKHVEYTLTPEGMAEAGSLFDDFCSELVRIYSSLKRAISSRLQELLRDDVRRVALFGAAETCEVTLSVLREMQLEIVAIVDNDPAKQGSLFHGMPVSAPGVLASCGCDAVLITSYANHSAIRQQVEPMLAPCGIGIYTL